MANLVTDSTRRHALSCIRRVDAASIWTYDATTGEQGRILVDDAPRAHLTLLPGLGRFFITVHSPAERSHVDIAVRTFASPVHPVAKVTAYGHGGEISGQASVFDSVPSAFLASLNGLHRVVTVRDQNVSVRALDWFDEDPSWDHDYQAMLSVSEIPETKDLLFTIQRSSTLVLCDPTGQHIRRRIPLDMHAYNLRPRMLNTRAQVVINVQGRLLTLERTTWEIVNSTVLEEGGDPRARIEMGELWVSPDEATAVVPRPSSGDALVFRGDPFLPAETIRVGSSPIVAALMKNGCVVARDSSAGGLLTGQASAP